MNFRDVLKEDNDSIFALDELAEFVNIDGVILRCQIAKHTEKISGSEKKVFEGLHGDFITLSFRKNDYCTKRRKIPKQGDVVYINAKKYFVQKSRNELDVVYLEVSENRQSVI